MWGVVAADLALIFELFFCFVCFIEEGMCWMDYSVVLTDSIYSNGHDLSSASQQYYILCTRAFEI